MRHATEALFLCLLASGAFGCPTAPVGFVDVECVPARQLQPQLNDNGTTGMVAGPLEAGFDVCDGKTWNRTDAVPCSTETRLRACEPGDEVLDCADDADCGRGRCLATGEGCACFDLCERDADCGAGEACVCTAGALLDGDSFPTLDETSTCVPAECKTGDDCGGGACGLVLTEGCGLPVELRCRAATDGCASSADCRGDDHCAADDAGGWSCIAGGTTCD